MKFLTQIGAPNIPSGLMQAHENGKLVFFCGAGISIEAGLPSFSQLVNNVYSRLGEVKSESEFDAFRFNLFDRTLGLLEERLVDASFRKSNIVRESIIKELTISDSVNVDIHKSILSLSKTKENKYRLVTTNFDRCFIKAKPEIMPQIDGAPKLPIPKPHKWSSVVHLHGIINESDPNGEHLVLTSGDFGTAYLTERWASKFVTELFTNFTVAFVGYSVNDPVIRYMTDAIAAEGQRGYKAFNQPYVFTRSKPSERLIKEKKWKAMGLKPIIYFYPHSNLSKTLMEWGNYVRDGLDAKARIVIKEGRKVPLKPFDQDLSVVKLVDVLSEKSCLSKDDVTGYPAKVFREMDNPPAPIEWLQVLFNNGLISIAERKEKVYPVNPTPTKSNLLHPNKISFQLWCWLLHHLESDLLIRWVIDQGTCLHPDLRQLIEEYIKNNSIKEPYLTFWKIMTSDFMECEWDQEMKAYSTISNLGVKNGYFEISRIEKLIQPNFKLQKSFDWGDLLEDEQEISSIKLSFEIEVTIGLSDSNYILLSRLESYPKKFESLMIPSTQALIKSINFWEITGIGDKLFDRSHWDMPSISPHDQNNRFNNWVILIELCRDLWISTWNTDKRKAISVLELWRSINRPVFRRLVLHAFTYQDVAKLDDIIDYLLDNNGWWLWSLSTHREVFRLLAVLWAKLDTINEKKLLHIILNGPPREMYKSDLSKQEWRRLSNRSVWLILAKLNSYGRSLPHIAEMKLQNYSKKYPEWKLQDEDRDEFNIWSGKTEYGHRADITVKDLFELEIEDLIKYLSEKESQYHKGRLNSFRVGCRDKTLKKAIKVLGFLAENLLWDSDIWRSGLIGLAESNENTWIEIAPLLVKADTDLYKNIAWAISYWTKINIQFIKCGAPEEKYFWSIFNHVLIHGSISTDHILDAMTYAQNHPLGIISIALIQRIGDNDISTIGRVPKGEFKDKINLLINVKTKVSLAGKIILASRLYYLFKLDPKWTKENLIPLFEWDGSETVKLFWQAYLWSPRISTELILAMKSNLLMVAQNVNQLNKSADGLLQLFCNVCIKYANLYTASEQRDIMSSAGPSGLIVVAKFLSYDISSDPQSADNYWSNRIQPFIKKAWPKGRKFITEESSKYLSLILVELDNTFEKGFDFLNSFIKPFEGFSSLISKINEKKLPDIYPKAVFNLLTFGFQENKINYIDIVKFRNVLERIIKADSSIQSETYYKIFNDYIIMRER
jgi:hypothetical protein